MPVCVSLERARKNLAKKGNLAECGLLLCIECSASRGVCLVVPCSWTLLHALS